MKYYLGIDGGGTKTVAAVSDEKGNILIKKTGKSINFYSVGMKKARENLSELISSICVQCEIPVFAGAYIGCSALDGCADEKLINELCDGVINAGKIGMHSDVYIALKSVSNSVRPCAAICGTGSMAIAEDKNGKTFVAGGWGHILGDEGSAYAIAIRTLKLCCQLSDEQRKTRLLETALCHFGAEDMRKIIDIVYSPETTKDVIALFAEKVGFLAESGDSDAADIIKTEAGLFAETVLKLISAADCDVVCLFGSVFNNNKMFVNAFSEKIQKNCTGIEIRMSEIPAEESALMLAREL